MYINEGMIYRVADEDFGRAYRQGIWHRLWAFLSGRPTQLLSYEAVVEPLGIRRTGPAEIQEVELPQITGSVGRAADFTAEFWPRRLADRQRWTGVKMAIMRMNGLSPVRLYQVGPHYFVVDGHHRISVARQLGVTRITALVTRIETERPYLIHRAQRMQAAA